jgi:hypothetical protein
MAVFFYYSQIEWACSLDSAFALRRLETEARCRRDVTTPLTISRGVLYASEFYMRQRTGRLGYPVPPWRHRFRIACAVFLPSPSAAHFRKRLILSCASQLLQSLSSHCPPGADVRATFPGLPSLIAASTGGVHQARASQARAVPSSTFLTSSTAYSSTDLRGFVSPRSHVQGSTLQGFPLVRSRTSSSPAVALVSLRAPPAPGCPSTPGTHARLQGLAPLTSPSQNAVV